MSNSLNPSESAACFPLSGHCMCNRTTVDAGVMLEVCGKCLPMADLLVLRLSRIWWTVDIRMVTQPEVVGGLVGGWSWTDVAIVGDL